LPPHFDDVQNTAESPRRSEVFCPPTPGPKTFVRAASINGFPCNRRWRELLTRWSHYGTIKLVNVVSHKAIRLFCEDLRGMSRC
jgi:hypothetical protein